MIFDGFKLAPLLLLVLAAAALAQADDSPTDIKAQRSRLLRERSAAEQQFAAEKQDCESRFAVTACLDRAKARRRSTLDDLARQKTVLDDIQRKQRAAARQREVEHHLREADDRAAAAPRLSTVVRAPRPASAKASRAASSAGANPAASTARPADGVEADAARREATNRQAYEKRQIESQTHREAVERRNAEQAARRAGAAGLPDPPTDATPR
jgi:hypothetical protein